MDSPVLVSPVALANTVTAYATILSGVLCIVLTFVTRPQPYRWLFFYFCIILTGIPTVWYHGFGETFEAGVADVGAEYLLVWSLQFAVLGDYYSKRHRLLIAVVSAMVNVAVVLVMVTAALTRSKLFGMNPQGPSWTTVSNAVLVVDAALVVFLFFAKLSKMYPNSKPLLYLNVAIFVVGLLLAGPANSTVGFGILAYQATWHIVGAFGFVTLWIFNLVRFAAIKLT